MVGFDLKEVVVYVLNPAWDGPDLDDDYLMGI